MSLKIREQKVLTREELLNARIQQNQQVLANFESAVKEMLASSREEYIVWDFEKKKERLAVYVKDRNPNETAEEFWLRKRGRKQTLRPGTPWEHQGYDRQDLSRASFYMAGVCRFTTHPAEPRHGSHKGWTEDEYEKYRAWLNDQQRPPFAVSFRADADERLRAESAEEADEIIKTFIEKTNLKILGILLARGDYTCELLRGGFVGGVFEGDIKVIFTDKTTFRTHVILKTNYSVLGNAYAQYPLTFHDVQVMGKGPALKMLSEEEVQKLLKVKPWLPPKVSKPWTKAGVGDVVRTGLGLGMMMSTRGSQGTVRHANGVEERVTGGDIEQVVAHTKALSWHSPPQVRVKSHEGQTTILTFPDYKADCFGSDNDKKLRLFALEKVLSSVK